MQIDASCANQTTHYCRDAADCSSCEVRARFSFLHDEVSMCVCGTERYEQTKTQSAMMQTVLLQIK